MQEFDRIISSLSPDMQTILRQLAAGGGALTARELLGLIARLTVLATEAQRATVWRALVWLANTGRIQLAVLIESAELMAAGEGAVITTAEAGTVGAGGAAAGGGAAVTAATVAVFVAATILAMEAIAIAYYSITAELETVAEIAPQGKPCKAGSGPTDEVFDTYVRAFGSRTSRNKAIKTAMNHAKRAVTCAGSCSEDPDGPQCTPVAIPISVIPKSRLIYTTTYITYRVGCACL